MAGISNFPLMLNRKHTRKCSGATYEEQIVSEAALHNKTYTYNKIEPTVFFWKELVAIDKETPTCLVPDTLVLNEKQTEIMWIYTDEHGRIAKDLNVNFKDFVSKLTNYSSPNELVALLKRPIFHDKLGYINELKFMSSRNLANCSRQQIGQKDQTMCLQRFVKSNGPQAFLCRTIYCKNQSSTCFLITNKKTFFDKEELEIKKLVARPKDRCTIVKSKQGKNLSDTKSTLERIMQFLLFHRGIELTELVGDFIKDEVGNWWLVSIKAFKMIEKLSRVKSSPIYGSGMMKMAPSSAKANKNSEQFEKQRYQKTKLCRYCEKIYLEPELTHRLTMRMIIEVDKYLLHLGKEFKWLKRSDIDNIDSNCLYQEHKVCQRCYRLYTEIQIIMEMEGRFTSRLGCQLESSPKELIISQTNGEQLRLQAKAKQLHLLKEGIPEVLELGPNSNIITRDCCPIKNDEIISKMVRFRFIIYLNEIDEVVNVDSGYNYYLEFSIFGKKARYKLDTSLAHHKIIPLRKLKVIYFFANSIQKMEDYTKSGASLRITITAESRNSACIERKPVGALEMPLKDFMGSLNHKKDFYKLFHLENMAYGWGLEGSIGIISSDGEVSTAKMIFKKSSGQIYLPSDNYYFCEHLPEEWIDHIKDKFQQNELRKETFSNKHSPDTMSRISFPEPERTLQCRSTRRDEKGEFCSNSQHYPPSLFQGESEGSVENREPWRDELRKEINSYESAGSRKLKKKIFY